MYGQNVISPIEAARDGQTLWIQEIFPTIQGEGPDVGTGAIFIRVGGCNLRCFYCDTDFSSSTWHPTLATLRTTVRKLRADHPGITLVVLTGGEPLRQNLYPLVTLLNDLSYRVQIETAGTYWPNTPTMNQRFRPGNRWKNSLICSPKTATLHPKILPLITAYKYIIFHGETDPLTGLPTASTQEYGKVRPVASPPPSFHGEIFVQPCDLQDPKKNHQNLQTCLQLVNQHGYRLSTQVHKIHQLP